MTQEELGNIIKKHALWLVGEAGGEKANLYGANLSEANLYEANLSEANLYGANLSEANLSGANLSGANLYGADLSEANLSGANLSHADLCEANLYGANLSEANLSHADLCEANLILAGQDIRGYLFWAFVGKSGVVEIRAGCRHFVGVSAARQHWSKRHTDNAILHEDCLSLIDRIERMATVRAWKIEPEVQP